MRLKIGRYVLTLQRAAVEAKQLARRLVRQRHSPVVVEIEDRQRAGLDQRADLQFRFPAESHLFLAFFQVFRQEPPPAVQLPYEEAGSGKAARRNNQAGNRSLHPMRGVQNEGRTISRGALQGVGGFPQPTAHQRHQQNLVSVQSRRREQHGEQVQKTQ
jgi:hypothetical protein